MQSNEAYANRTQTSKIPHLNHVFIYLSKSLNFLSFRSFTDEGENFITRYFYQSWFWTRARINLRMADCRRRVDIGPWKEIAIQMFRWNIFVLSSRWILVFHYREKDECVYGSQTNARQIVSGNRRDAVDTGSIQIPIKRNRNLFDRK